MPLHQFLMDHRFEIIAAYVAASAIALAVLYLKFYRPRRRMPKPLKVFEQPKVVEATEREIRLMDENTKLRRELARLKVEKVERLLQRQAEKRLKELVPSELEQISLSELVGRPIYYHGGVPIINAELEAQRIAEELKLPLPMALKKLLVRRLILPGHTLYFYTVRMLPNGLWAVVASSKPPKLKKGRWKLGRLARTYLIEPSQHASIDSLILNRWEAVNTGAAIILASTFLGPFPVDKYAELMGVHR